MENWQIILSIVAVYCAVVIAVGCYVDHELLVNLEEDNKKRADRARGAGPVRILMNVGGAGAGGDMFRAMISHLLPYVDRGEVALFLNTGDHTAVFDSMASLIGKRDDLHIFKEFRS